MEQSIPAIIGLPLATSIQDGAWMHFSCEPGDHLKIEKQKVTKACKQLLDKHSDSLFETCDNQVILNHVVDRMIALATIPRGNLSSSKKLKQMLQKKLEAKLNTLLNSYDPQTLTSAQRNAYQQHFERIAEYLPHENLQKLLLTEPKPKWYSKGESLVFLHDRLQKVLSFSPMIKVNVPKLFIIERAMVQKGWRAEKKEFTPEFKEYFEAQIASMKFPVIARSSSELEDSSSNRAAGIFSSVVAKNKQAIWRALTEVIESENSERAREYKKRIGAGSELSMSIIVQEYVPNATISGVLMTSTNSKKWEMSQVQIVEGFGSGVDDNKEVSLFGVNAKTKTIEYCTNFGVPFDPQVIVSIAVVGKMLEDVYGYVLDIEWVYDAVSQTLWIVQAAPRKSSF